MADYLSNLLVRLKSTDVTGSPTDGAAVASVTPTTGPLLAAAHAADGQYPRYKLNQFLGNKPGILCGVPGDGSTNGFGQCFATTALTNAAGSYTFVFAAKLSTSVFSNAILSDISSDRFLVDLGTGSPLYGYFAGSGFVGGGPGVTDLLSHILVWSFDATAGTGTVYADGVQVFQGAYSARAIQPGAELIIGGGSGGPNYGILQTLAEYRLYNVALSPTQVSDITAVLTETYIAASNPAMALTVAAPAYGDAGVASTITVSTVGALSSGKPLTFSDGGRGGTFGAATLPAGSNSSVTVPYTPASGGPTTITVSTTGLTSGTASLPVRPALQTITPAATTAFFTQAWNKTPSSIKVWGAGNYYKDKFSGTSYTITVNPTLFGSLLKPTVRVTVDGGSPHDVVMTSSTEMVLAVGIAAGQHTILVELVRTQQDGDRWSGTNNTLSITGFKIDAGASLFAPAHFADEMVGWGDSTEEGILAVGNDSGYAGTDGTVTYFRRIAAQNNAEISLFGNGHATFNSGDAQGVPSFTTAWRYKQDGVLIDYTKARWLLQQFGANNGLPAAALKTWMEEARLAFPTLSLVNVMPFDGVRNSNRTTITAGHSNYSSAHPSDTNILLIDGGSPMDALHLNTDYSSDELHYRTAGYAQAFSITQIQTATITSLGADTDPPGVSSAALAANGTSLTITLDEPGVGADGFSLLVAGTVRAVNNWTRATTTTITGTLASAATAGQSVQLSYSTLGNVLDSAGNELVAFTNYAVVNNSTVIAPVTPEITSVTVDPAGPLDLDAGESQQFDSVAVGTGNINTATVASKQSGVGTMTGSLYTAPSSESTSDRSAVLKFASVATPSVFELVTVNIPGVPVEPPPVDAFVQTIALGRGYVTEMQRLTAGDGPVRVAYYAGVYLPRGAVATLIMRRGEDVYPFTGTVLYGPDGLLEVLVDEVPEEGDYLVQFEVGGVAYPSGFPIRVTVSASLEAI